MVNCTYRGHDSESFPASRLPPGRRELALFCLLGALGAAASYLSVNIPNTAVFIEGRWAFGFMGFALLRRWWSALLLACLLSVTGFHKIPLMMCLLGNMLYAFPALVTIRFIHARVLMRPGHLAAYGVGWLLLVLACYQVYTTPAVWGFMALLKGAPIWPMIRSGWAEQPFLIESILVGIVSTAGMVMLRSHEALRMSRRELSITLDSIGDGVIVTDEQGRIDRMNPVAQTLTGWTLEDARGRPLTEVFRVFNALTMEPVESPVERVVKEAVVVGLGNHTCLIAKDGTKRQIADSAAPVWEVDGRLIGVVMVFRDVTDEYEARALLRRKDELLAKSQALAHVGSWELEGGTNRLFWSDEVYRILGLAPQEFGAAYEAFLDLVPQEDRRNLDDAYFDSIREGKDVFEIEHRVLRRDTGEVRIVHEHCYHERDESGNFLRSVGMMQDITERKQFEEKLRDKEARLRAILEASPDPIAVYDIEGHPQYVNPSFTRVFGWSLDELRGNMIPFVPEDQREIVREKIQGLFKSGTVEKMETKRLTREGKVVNVIISAALVKGSDGIPVGMVVNLTDVTEQRRLEQNLRQAQKMESIGTLAGGIAHDFNNILSPIMVYSELAMMDLPADSPVRQNLRHIYQAGERARDLVKQILTFARKREEARIPIKTSQIVKEVIKFLRSTIPSTIDIRYDCRTRQDTVLADPTQMNQIVMNLCTNAAHAMRERGGILGITLTDETVETEGMSGVDGLAPGRYLRLTVSDTGPGIPPGIIDKIFEPYFTTKGPSEGTGMGLAVIHGIVKNYSGDIIVESEEGKGTTFHVMLPVIDTEVSLATEPDIDLPGGTERILFVDDEKAAFDTVQAMLKKLGYEVTARTSSIEALDLFRKRPDSFDLVITDQTMPHMTGKELARELMAIRPDIPVILCTGFSEQIDERIAKEIGIRAFVMKPFFMHEIAVTIRDVLDQGQY